MRLQLRRRIAAVLLLPSVLVLASCGGGGGEGDVQDLLDKAFQQEIKSADLKVDATIQLKGTTSLSRPVRIQANGPFKSNDGKLPSVDIELKIGSGGGQTVQTGFLSTGDRAFVKFQDVFYEQPAADVRRSNQSIKRNSDRRSSLKSLGLDPRSWLGEAKERGEEEVAGVKTTHVSGTLDTRRVVRDLNEFVKKSSSAITGATGQTPPSPLSDSAIEKTAQVIKNPSFDVYVGKDDETIRRVSGRLDFDVPRRIRRPWAGWKAARSSSPSSSRT